MWTKKLNRTLAINSSFQTFAVGLLVKFIYGSMFASAKGGRGGVVGWARTPKALPGDATFITDLKINFEMYKSRYVIYFNMTCYIRCVIYIII